MASVIARCLLLAVTISATLETVRAQDFSVVWDSGGPNGQISVSGGAWEDYAAGGQSGYVQWDMEGNIICRTDAGVLVHIIYGGQGAVGGEVGAVGGQNAGTWTCVEF